MTRLTETPFFVVGNPRSGTTLLRFILSSHPRLYIPDETGFCPFLLKDVEAKLSLVQVEQILIRIGKLNREWQGMVNDIPAFYEALPEPTLSYVLDALYRQRIAPYGAKRWGDKTPSYVLYIPVLNRIFPNAQFIHLIRDGRDAALSARRKWAKKRRYMDGYYLLKNWTRHVEQGRKAGRLLGSHRYLEIRYKSLVEQPGQTVARICAFLGEEFHIEMLNHTQLAKKQIGLTGHVEVREPISTASVQRWKVEMSSFEQKLAHHIAGPLLTELEYEVANLGPFSLNEWLQYLLLAGKFLVTSSIRNILYGIGFFTLNRNKRR